MPHNAWGLISTPPPIIESMPLLQLLLEEDTKKPSLPVLTQSNFFYSDLLLSFRCPPLCCPHPRNLPPCCPHWLHWSQRVWCHCAALHMHPCPPPWSTFHHFPHQSLQFSLTFSSFSPSVSFEQMSWCRTHAVEGTETGRSKVTYPSLVHAAPVQQSISVLSFHLDGHLLGRYQPNQIKGVREIVQILPITSSSTPNQPSQLLVLLQICPRAALPPILSTHHCKIGAFPLNFVANVG